MSDYIEVGFIETQTIGFRIDADKAQDHASRNNISVEAAAIQIAYEMSESNADYCMPEGRNVSNIHGNQHRSIVEPPATEAGICCADDYLHEDDPDRMAKQKHIDSPNGACMYCGSNHIEGGHVEIENNHASQEIYCTDCDKGYVDEYTLTSVRSLD